MITLFAAFVFNSGGDPLDAADSAETSRVAIVV